MSTATHTSGEWTAHKTHDYDDGWQIENEDGYRIAMVPNSSERPENAANAHLITGAPSLLEVLREIISDGVHCDVVPHLHRKAVAAIAKALGSAA